MKLLLFTLVSLFVCGNGRSPIVMQKEVVKYLIDQWYSENPNGHTVYVGKDAKTEIDNLNRVVIHDKESNMVVTVAFEDGFNVKDAGLTTEQLNANLDYVTISNIPAEIPASGWRVHPEVPRSRYDSEEGGVTLSINEDRQLSFVIDWETYTVRGDSLSQSCLQGSKIADLPTPAECFVTVDKRLPLVIDINGVSLE